MSHWSYSVVEKCFNIHCFGEQEHNKEKCVTVILRTDGTFCWIIFVFGFPKSMADGSRVSSLIGLWLFLRWMMPEYQWFLKCKIFFFFFCSSFTGFQLTFFNIFTWHVPLTSFNVIYIVSVSVCMHVTLNAVIILDVILHSIVTRVMGELLHMWVSCHFEWT